MNTVSNDAREIKVWQCFATLKRAQLPYCTGTIEQAVADLRLAVKYLKHVARLKLHVNHIIHEVENVSDLLNHCDSQTGKFYTLQTETKLEMQKCK